MALNDNSGYRISAPALHAARTLMKHFDFVPKRGGRIKGTENNIAVVIDVCTQSFRMQGALEMICRSVPRFDRVNPMDQIHLLKEMIASIDLVRNKAPRFGESVEVPMWQRQGVEIELTKGQMEDMRHVSSALASARSVQEEQRILQRAGIGR